MKLDRTRRRRGFTFIELLVSIGIIALLISMLTAGVVFSFNKVDQVRTTKEISSLSQAIRQFEADYNITAPPPSRLWLDNSASPYSTPPAGYTPAQVQQLGIDSQNYLRQVWPRINFSANDWTSSGTTPPAPFNGILEGEECLVLFVGGARNSSGAFIGFSTADPSKPMDVTAATALKRKGPYYTFDASRITVLPGRTFSVYNDPYGTPYAYFSSGKGANRYDAYFGPGPTFLGTHDCTSLSATLQPYFTGTRYYNADTFQIISAGKNQQFGSGGNWTPTFGPAGTGVGADDMSNFYDARLGVTP
jgi:prepilin-type N-terminal cleavage/methylation domain-containing protein